MREGTQKILAVDFDGTITADGHGANMVLRQGCEEALKELHALGFELILWTCRSGVWLKQATDFLEAEGLLKFFSKVNENSDRIYGPNTRKVIADLYIDDRVLGGFTSWPDVVNKVKSRFLPPMVSRKKIISDQDGEHNPNSLFTTEEVVFILSEKDKGENLMDVYKRFQAKASYACFYNLWVRKTYKKTGE